jgi:hypothetical protein
MPNGFDLSGPAKAPSHYRAELAGSAPLACGLGRQRVVRQNFLARKGGNMFHVCAVINIRLK